MPPHIHDEVTAVFNKGCLTDGSADGGNLAGLPLTRSYRHRHLLVEICGRRGSPSTNAYSHEGLNDLKAPPPIHSKLNCVKKKLHEKLNGMCVWDSLSELRSCLCERRLERAVLRPALLPVKTVQFTQFFR